MNLATRASDVLALLRELGHEAALIGGLAVSIRARERMTRDIDLAVAVATDGEAEQLARSMQDRGFELLVVVEQEAMDRIATLRFRDPRADTQEPTLDLVCGTCGIEQEIVNEATPERLQPSGTQIPVARIPHLIAMKVLSENPARPQDRWDLQVLVQAASDPELERAAALLQLIEQRGFHRDRDLGSRFHTFLSEHKGES